MGEFFAKLLEWLSKIVVGVVAVGTTVGVFLEWIVEGFTDPATGLISTLKGWAFAGNTDLTDNTFVDWSVINALVPLAEGAQLLISLLALYTIVLAVRWIKSFIPTLAG